MIATLKEQKVIEQGQGDESGLENQELEEARSGDVVMELENEAPGKHADPETEDKVASAAMSTQSAFTNIVANVH